MSLYVAQAVPYLVCVILATESRWLFRTSQTATNCTSGIPIIGIKTPVPRDPIPIPPKTIRSLGATLPSPQRRRGNAYGNITAPAAVEIPLRNVRRFTLLVVLMLLVFIGVSCCGFR